jgi:hypothetical protein
MHGSPMSSFLEAPAFSKKPYGRLARKHAERLSLASYVQNKRYTSEHSKIINLIRLRIHKQIWS